MQVISMWLQNNVFNTFTQETCILQMSPHISSSTSLMHTCFSLGYQRHWLWGQLRFYLKGTVLLITTHAALRALL